MPMTIPLRPTAAKACKTPGGEIPLRLPGVRSRQILLWESICAQGGEGCASARRVVRNRAGYARFWHDSVRASEAVRPTMDRILNERGSYERKNVEEAGRVPVRRSACRRAVRGLRFEGVRRCCAAARQRCDRSTDLLFEVKN